jgi:hypothetical protein
MSQALITRSAALTALGQIHKAPNTEVEQTDNRLHRLPAEVTQNIARHLRGSYEGLEGFRALRHTWKALFLKTFHEFGLAYFTMISVAFDIASLQRLRALVNHRNSFGLSLRSFPVCLICSTYRLPTGDAVRECLLTTSDPDRSPFANEVADAISRACQQGPRLFELFYKENDSPCVTNLAHQYMESAEQQETMEATGYDVKTLAEALVAFPNIRGLASYGTRGAWGQENWETFVGIQRDSFLHMEYLESGETNLTIAVRKLLSAIARATVLRRSRGRKLIIQQLDLHG